MIPAIRYIFVALSMFGALLTAMPWSMYRAAGFGLWVVSNLGWLADASMRRDMEQRILFAFYLATALIGLALNLREGWL